MACSIFSLSLLSGGNAGYDDEEGWPIGVDVLAGSSWARIVRGIADGWPSSVKSFPRTASAALVVSFFFRPLGLATRSVISMTIEPWRAPEQASPRRSH